MILKFLDWSNFYNQDLDNKFQEQSFFSLYYFFALSSALWQRLQLTGSWNYVTIEWIMNERSRSSMRAQYILKSSGKRSLPSHSFRTPCPPVNPGISLSNYQAQRPPEGNLEASHRKTIIVPQKGKRFGSVEPDVEVEGCPTTKTQFTWMTKKRRGPSVTWTVWKSRFD